MSLPCSVSYRLLLVFLLSYSLEMSDAAHSENVTLLEKVNIHCLLLLLLLTYVFSYLIKYHHINNT